jgi:rhodanese-related sulfurtransferase
MGRIYLVLGTLVGIIATGLLVFYGPASMNPMNLMSSGTVSTGDRMQPDPLRLFASLERPDLASNSPIKETSGCGALPAWYPVKIAQSQIDTLFVRNSALRVSRAFALVLDGAANCIKPGYPARLSAQASLSPLHAEVGWMMPTAILPLNDQNKAVARPLIDAAEGDEANSVIVVGVTLSQRGVWHLGVPPAPRMEGARVIDRAEFEAAVQSGWPVIDVRSASEHTVLNVQNSVNLPYVLAPRALIREPISMWGASGDEHQLARLQLALDKEVVVVGQGSADLRAYRTAALLADRGYQKVFYFWEGMDYFLRNRQTPPVTSELIQVVNLEEAFRVMSDPANPPMVIDVRAPAQFEQGAINKARNYPMQEKGPVPFRRSGLSARALKAYGEKWILPTDIPRTRPLLIYGFDSDWTAYKAALLAKEDGFSTVYWMRAGYLDWSTYFPSSVTRPQRPTSRGGAPSQPGQSR